MLKRDMEIFGIILAGGKGSRLGGVDKAQLRFNGAQLLHHVKTRIAPQCCDLAIAVGAQSDAQAFELPMVFDPFSPAIGPLGGVVAGADWASSRAISTSQAALLTAPVDGPYFPQDFVSKTQDHLDHFDVVVGRFKEDLYPVCALWRLNAAVQIRQLREKASSNAPRTIFAQLKVQEVDFAQYYDTNPFSNVNKIEQLLRL